MKQEVILIHGWDPARYNSALSNLPQIESNVGWNKSLGFISLLEEVYKINYCNLPGFCGVPEPKKSCFSLEDFSDYVYAWKNQFCPSAKLIISYSFGGAVSVYYKNKYKDKVPLVLISPAIKRKETFKSRLAHFAKSVFPKSISNFIKGKYQSMASEYYRKGSPFLRSTYDVIVREDLTPLIANIPNNEAFFIFGEKDDETPWNLVSDYIFQFNHKYKIIDNGTHSVIKSHPQLLIDEIKVFSQQAESNEIQFK